MLSSCENGECKIPLWIKRVLLLAGLYHLALALWINCWPTMWFQWMSVDSPNHLLLIRVIGIGFGVLGIFLVMGSRDPIKNWPVVIITLFKFLACGILFFVEIVNGFICTSCLWWLVTDSLIWLPAFFVIAWACLKAQAGVPPSRNEPYSPAEASQVYLLSTGETLAQASENKTLAIVFLRHFGCTFTRQILRGLESIDNDAKRNGATLVLVHMLQRGAETKYLGERSGIPRIADPRCELYRAFGLGKGGFLELFGPQVWWRGAISIFQGCGVGHLAGDGLQMPGAFLFRNGQIISSQRARSAAELPNVKELFVKLPEATSGETVSA